MQLSSDAPSQPVMSPLVQEIAARADLAVDSVGLRGHIPLMHKAHEGPSVRRLRLASSPRRVPVGFRKMPPIEDLAAESARWRRGGPLLPGPAASRSLLAVDAGGRLGPSLELGCSSGCSEGLSEPVEEPEENARMLRSLKGVCWDGPEACRRCTEGLL